MGEFSNSLAASLAEAFDRSNSQGSVPLAEQVSLSRPKIVAEAARLRTNLALRGRTDPRQLLDATLDVRECLDVLDLVVRECDTSSPEGWILNDSARRREFERLGHLGVLAALRNFVDDRDGVREALNMVFNAEGPLDLDNKTVSQLRTLLAIEPAVLGIAPSYPDPAEIRRLVAFRSRLEEFVRFSSGSFIGRTIEFEELIRFTRADVGSKQRVASLLLWGTGGIGKSTLIAAALASIMRDKNSRVVPVHLDFDRRDLAIENTLGLSLEVLRQIGTTDPAADQRLKKLRDDLRESLRLGFENTRIKASENAASNVLTGMRGCLSFLRGEGKRVLLVLDTFENVENSGDGALIGLRRWIEQLALVSGAPQILLVVAGRTDPAVNGLNKNLGWAPKTIVRKLEDLSGPEACLLLKNGGVPLATADAIYRALGGNPLVLSLIRRMFEATGNLGEIERVATDVATGLIDPTIIQGVLYDRFLKHVPSEDARLYAHPGLVLPEITPELIRRVLGPLKGEPGMSPKRSNEIFDALASASWLVHREGRTLSQRPDVRRLTLKLMTADPKRTREVERIRLQAMLYHASSSSPANRAALAYHLLMRVREKEDLDLLDGLNLSGTGSYIRKLADDLPDRARAFAEVLDFESGTGRSRRAIGARSIPAEQALSELPDDLWHSFMAGDDSRNGEGDRLVDHGDPLTALDLWRRRPAGADGTPPNFVLRALADTGEWSGEEADISALTEELQKSYASRDLVRHRFDERLYWTVCYALLSNPFGFAREGGEFRPLISLLKRHHERRQKSFVGRNIIALSAVIEGLCEEKIVPERWFDSGSPYASCTRLHLQRGRWSGTFVQWQVELRHLVTLQRDFASAFSNKQQDVIRAGIAVVFHSRATNATANLLRSVQSDIDALQGKPLIQVNKLLETINRKVTIRVGRHDLSDKALEVRLLRGSTPELYRPARQALVEALVENRYETVPNRSTRERIQDFASEAFKLLTIRPAELNPRRFGSYAAADPQGALLSFVEFADRARVLESVLLVARSHAIDDTKIMRVISTLRAWDWALGRQSADWGTVEAGQ